mmetsp:Transcript_42751/g.100206  ORF Transcript_42751/g.100206 Transcript_42751/m.100206 type:complete len:213 (-) Transcript_42751:1119-1757(-)
MGFASDVPMPMRTKQPKTTVLKKGSISHFSSLFRVSRMRSSCFASAGNSSCETPKRSWSAASRPPECGSKSGSVTAAEFWRSSGGLSAGVDASQASCSVCSSRSRSSFRFSASARCRPSSRSLDTLFACVRVELRSGCARCTDRSAAFCCFALFCVFCSRIALRTLSVSCRFCLRSMRSARSISRSISFIASSLSLSSSFLYPSSSYSSAES